MEKIICDYCGTLYDPEEKQCPICGGTQVPEEEETVVEAAAQELVQSEVLDIPDEPEEETVETLAEEPADELVEDPEEEPVAVADSLGDTRKIEREELSELAKNQAKEETPAEAPAEEPLEEEPEFGGVEPTFTEDLDITLEELNDYEETEERPLPKALRAKKKSGRGSRIVCAILAILVVGFALYIGYRFAAPYILPAEPTETTLSSEPTTEATEPSKDCTAILVEKNVNLTEVGETLQLEVTLTPADTEDVVTYVSDNPNVATVTPDGLVTAVNAGRANITITCGNVITSCAVDCEFNPIPTEPPTTEPEPETRPANPTTHYLTLEDEIHLTGDVDEVTVKIGGQEMHLRLRNKDENGKVLKVEWKVEDPEILEMDWNSIIPKKAGTTMITGEYDGETYHCVVHVEE